MDSPLIGMHAITESFIETLSVCLNKTLGF